MQGIKYAQHSQSPRSASSNISGIPEDTARTPRIPGTQGLPKHSRPFLLLSVFLCWSPAVRVSFAAAVIFDLSIILQQFRRVLLGLPAASTEKFQTFLQGICAIFHFFFSSQPSSVWCSLFFYKAPPLNITRI